MAGLQLQIVHVAGAGAGEVIGRIVRELAGRGYRVARLRAAEAPGRACDEGGAVALVSSGGASLCLPPEPQPETLRRLRLALHDHQLILAEGFSENVQDLIEVAACDGGLGHARSRVLRAVIGGAGDQAGVPCFAREDTQGQCAFIEERYLKPNLSGAILAGGRSSRLGRDKTLVPVGGQPLIGRMIALLSRHVPLVRIIAVGSGAYACYGLETVADIYPGCGPLSGIHAALSASATEYVMVLSGDMPLMRDELLERLRRCSGGYDITLYKHKNFEPLCAVYRRSCLEALEELIRHGDGRIIDLFPTLSVQVLRTADPEVFRSINTEDDYRFVVSRLQPGP